MHSTISSTKIFEKIHLLCFVFFLIQWYYSAFSARTHLIPFNLLVISELCRVCHFPSSENLCDFYFNFYICLHSLQRSWFGHFVVETFLCDFVKMNEALKYIDNNNNIWKLRDVTSLAKYSCLYPDLQITLYDLFSSTRWRLSFCLLIKMGTSGHTFGLTSDHLIFRHLAYIQTRTDQMTFYDFLFVFSLKWKHLDTHLA